jgi:hypothetical protein
VVNNIQVQRVPAAGTPSATVAAPAATLPRRAAVGTVTSVDTTRNQVTVVSGNEQLLLQLPARVVRDLRPGDQLSLDVTVQPTR